MTAKCAKCGAAILPHRACEACGAYAERSVKPKNMEEVKKVLDKKAGKKPKKAAADVTETPAPEAKA